MREGLVRVLLIEDDPDDALLVREMLDEAEGTHFELELAERLSEGVELLRAHELDVILLDLSLPDMRGLATLGVVRTEAPDLPIVVLTGLDDKLRAIEALQCGAEDYLVKGQDTSSSLARCIRYAVERQRLEARLEETLEWERRDWARRQGSRDYRRYVAMRQGKTAARALDDQALQELTEPYRGLVLSYADAADPIRAAGRTKLLQDITECLAAAGARSSDVVRLHLRVFSDFASGAEPSDDYQDFLTESRLVLLEIMAGLADAYLNRHERSGATDERRD